MIKKNSIIIDKFKSNDNSLINRFIKAIFYGVGGAVGSRFFMLVSGIIISRIIGKDSYGEFSHVNSTVTLFVTFSGMGISSTLTRYIAINKQDTYKTSIIVGTLSKVVVIFSAIMSIGMYFLSKPISILTTETDTLTNYYRFASIAILFAALSSIEQSILLGFEKFKASSTIEVLRTALYLIVSIVFTLRFGIYGAIISLIITFMTKYVLMRLVNSKHYKKIGIIPKTDFNNEIKGIIKTFTIPAFLSSIFVLPINWINNSLLAKYSGFGELAIFAVSLQWMTLITFIPYQLSKVKPIYSDLYNKKSYDSLFKYSKKISILLSFFVGLIVIIGIAFGKIILSLYGDGYLSGIIPFRIMLLSAFIITIQSQIGPLIESIGKMWIGLTLNLVWSFSILVIFYFLRHYGSLGYSISYLASYFIHTVFSFTCLYYIRKKEKLYGDKKD